MRGEEGEQERERGWDVWTERKKRGKKKSFPLEADPQINLT